MIILGIGGFLLSTLTNISISVGASGSIMGIIGGYLVFILINWNSL